MLLVVAAALAGCPATSADLTVALDDAEAAWSGMDTDGLRLATDLARAEAGCLAETVPRATVARLHRVVGLRAFLDDDEAKTDQAFAAARAIEGAYRFPEAFVPADHPVQRLYAAANPAAGSVTKLPVPAQGRLEFDGRASQDRPSAWPTLAAHIGDDGAMRKSAYLWPSDPMLAYGVATERRGSVASRARKGPNVPLTVLAIASVAASGACYAVAKVSFDGYHAADVSTADLEELRTRTNTFFAASVGVGVVAVGAGAGAIITGTW